MTQDEKWKSKCQVAMTFIATNKRNPSKFVGEEREIRTWIKHNRKLLNAGTMKPERVAKFMELLELGENYKHKNQYQ